ncbi:unnamed protein product, partial [marine sediment metagenome]
RPICNYAKKAGYDVEWSAKYLCNDGIISCVISHPSGIYMPHGNSAENFIDTKHQATSHPLLKGILLPGPYWKQKFYSFPITEMIIASDVLENQELYNYEFPETKLKVVGWPKSDLLFSSRRKEVKAHWENTLKLPYDKTVLYSGDSYVKNLIDITENLEMNLIWKPALPVTQGRRPQYFNFKDRLKYDFMTFPEITKKYSYFKHVNFVNPLELEDITELFLVSDVAVSPDGSSVGIEFITANKPLIALTRKRIAGFHCTEEEMPAIFCFFDKMENALIHCLEKPNDLKKQRETFLKKMV